MKILPLFSTQSIECPEGKFGASCTQTCHCANGGCLKDTGECENGGCAAGWTGVNCQGEFGWWMTGTGKWKWEREGEIETAQTCHFAVGDVFHEKIPMCLVFYCEP